MRPECIKAVSDAVGRKLKKAEIDGIEKTLAMNLQKLAKQDPKALAAMTSADRLHKAAEMSAKQLIAESERIANRAALNVIARAKNAEKFNELVKKGVSGRNAVERILNRIDADVKGTQHEYFSLLGQTLDAASPTFLGMMENRTATHNFIREVFGESTGDKMANSGAKAWKDTIELMRQRFNNEGGDIGKLGYGYIPQSHNQAKVLKAGAEQWTDFVFNKLDRSRYINEDGQIMNDDELRAFLSDTIYETIATGGVNKIDTTVTRYGSGFAKKWAEHREVHFKDAQSWIDYSDTYGQGTLYEAIRNHVNGLSRDITVIENLGANPQATFDMLHKMAIKVDGREKSIGSAFTSMESLFKVLTNKDNHAINPSMIDINQGTRNLIVAAKLQGTPLSSVTDIPTLIVTTKFHNMSLLSTIGNVFKSLGSDYKEFASLHGLMADSMINDMNRFAHGKMTDGWTGKLAYATNKASLLNAWTDSLKRGFQISMMNAIGKLSFKSWESLSPSDISRFEFQGVTKEIFDVWRLAEKEAWRGNQMLTPDAIRSIPDEKLAAFGDANRVKNAAVSKLLGFIIDESEYAVTTPDLTTRASLGGSTQKGTFAGEMARHLSLFKSFPLAMVNRHVRRSLYMNGEASQPYYAAGIMTGLVTFGALALQLKSLVVGKDPENMSTPKFWGRALIQGGGLGIFGDVLATGIGGQNRGGQSNYAALMGPVFGTAFDLGNVTIGNLGQIMRGERTNFGGEAVRFARQNLPFINLWYARSAIDHAFLFDLQNQLSPGYLNKMKARAYKDFGQKYWWEPQDGLPERAPDFAAALGN